MKTRITNAEHCGTRGAGKAGHLPMLVGFMLALALPVGAVAAPSGHDIELTTQGGLGLKTADGDFTFKLGGVVQADGAIFNEDKTDLGNGVEIHHARLAVSGTVFRDWAYKLQLDFASSSEIKSAYIRYLGFRPVAITMGNFKQPFSLQNITSLKYTTFMERSLFNGAITPG